MKNRMSAGLLVAILAFVIIVLIVFSNRSHTVRNLIPEKTRHSSDIAKSTDLSDRSFDTSSDSYLNAANLERLLTLSNLELKKTIEGLGQVRAASVLNAIGRMASADINSRGDFSLASRLVGILDHRDAAKILECVLHSKSPLGWELDFREQTKLVGVFSSGKPSSFLQGNFLRSFGALQGEDVAKSGTVPPLNKYEYMIYLDGVCQTTREAAFGNLLLIQDKVTLEMAVERAVTALMAGDAEGFSVFLGKMPPSETKDLAVLQMIKWLTKENASAECAPWLEAIHSPAIKIKALHVVESDAFKATDHSRE